MKTEKKLIERNLPFTKKYHYVDIRRGNIMDGDATCCDNCGKLITNIVHIVDDNKKHYYIGTDCSKTLVKAQCLYNVYGADYNLDINSLDKLEKFVREINAGVPFVITKDKHFVFLKNRKGTDMTESYKLLNKYYPEIIAAKEKEIKL